MRSANRDWNQGSEAAVVMVTIRIDHRGRRAGSCVTPEAAPSGLHKTPARRKVRSPHHRDSRGGLPEARRFFREEDRPRTGCAEGVGDTMKKVTAGNEYTGLGYPDLPGMPKIGVKWGGSPCPRPCEADWSFYRGTHDRGPRLAAALPHSPGRRLE